MVEKRHNGEIVYNITPMLNVTKNLMLIETVRISNKSLSHANRFNPTVFEVEPEIAREGGSKLIHPPRRTTTVHTSIIQP